MVSKHLKSAGIVASLLAVSVCAPATSQPLYEDEQVRLASAEEGEAIVETAWELRRGLGPKPDCSHFVNAVYAQSGFDYKYARSTVVFDGIPTFARVPRPQPGDLVVWRGHIGIVVDPDEHSFYSSVLSGFAIEDYRSNYWSNRGRPRFYRYLVDEVHSSRIQARLKAERTMPSVDHPRADSSPGLQTKRDLNSPADATDGSSTRSNTKFEFSDAEVFDAVFVSRRAKPSKSEILGAIVRSADANGERLLRPGRLDSQPMILVADPFTVGELNIHDRSGWVGLEANQATSIRYGKTDLKRTDARLRVSLRRDEQGWILLWPRDRIYMRRELAIRVLANHLAAKSRVSADAQGLRNVVRALDELLEEKSQDASGAP